MTPEPTTEPIAITSGKYTARVAQLARGLIAKGEPVYWSRAGECGARSELVRLIHVEGAWKEANGLLCVDEDDLEFYAEANQLLDGQGKLITASRSPLT